MVDRRFPAQAREGLVDKLGAVVCPEELDVMTDVDREFLRHRGQVGRALAA